MSNTIMHHLTYAVVIILLHYIRKQRSARKNALVEIPNLRQSLIYSQNKWRMEMLIVNFLIMLINQHPCNGCYSWTNKMNRSLFAQ